MKNKVIKRVLALSLAACMVIPALSYVGSLPEAKAADTTVVSEVGDTNSDGKIDAKELVRVKKSALPPNQVAAITINKMGSDDGKMSFITKEAYAAGSTVTFDILIPENLSSSWWGIGYATSSAAAGLYTHSSAAMNLSVTLGEWSSCSFELPEGDGNYYIYLLAAVGEWPKTDANAANTVFLIDNFKITTGNETVEDNFDNGFEEGFFNVNPNGEEAVSLYTLPGQDELKEQCDLNNDGACENADANLMRQYLVDKIYSFYRPDTSSVSNDTATYQVTDELDREMTDTLATKSGKAVGIRYFLHFGTEESKALYSVSNILANDPLAHASSDAWEAAGGGVVGTKHWWGKSLFGYYTSLDKWVVERDVQMLTDAGVDFLAIDTEDGVYTEQLTLLLEVLDKYYDQGLNVPKVTFTSDVSSSVETFKSTYSHLWYTVDTISAISNMETVHAASSLGSAMSASAFYNDSINHQRDFNGRKHINETDSELQGYNFKWEFENAVQNGATTILVESWNEWLSERKASSNSSQPIVLEENADMANSSDFQPMEEGYGDSYYMQLIDCIKEFKGNTISNNKLNTAAGTESVTIDIDGDFKQWNRVSTHYLDYTDEIDDRDAEAYSDVEIVKNNMLAFTINNINEIADYKPGVKPSFVTKNTYAGGSKVSFKAYIPEGSTTTWWGICWSTSLDNVSNYNCFSNSTGASLAVTKGQWYECTATLPNDSNNYYIYLVGELGQWGTTQILIDDFKITSGNTTVKDDFSNGISGGLFTNQYDVSGGATLYSASTTITNQAAAITINKMESEDGKMSFITKEAYAAGSTVEFDILIPENLSSSWWGIGYATSTSAASLYNHSSAAMNLPVTIGEWSKCSFTLPEGDGSYYIYLLAAVGEWPKAAANAADTVFLIDNFVVKKGSEIAEENFNSGLDGMFKVNTSGSGGNTCVSTIQRPTTYTDNSGRNDISRMKMTTDGSYLYALVETVDAIQGWGEANCMSLFISTGNVGGCWNQYEYVINRDSSKATSNGLVIEKYVSGAWKNVGTATYRIQGNLMHLAIPLSALDSSDAFELEFKWADNYSEDDIYSLYKSGDVAPYGRVNYVYSVIGKKVAITVNKMNSNTGNMSFITKEAYPAGSTVTFDILVPENISNSWWGIGFASDPVTADLYAWTSGTQYGKQMSSTLGSWTRCSIDIPSGNGDQYIYLFAAVGEWPKADANAADTVFQLDNFEITNGENVIARETFNSGYGIFDVDENAVALQPDSSSDSNLAAEIHIEHLNTNAGGWNFITKESYPKGTKIVFDAYIPSGTSGNWWGAVVTPTPSAVDIYACAVSGNSLPMSTTDKWVTFDKTITEDDSYFMIGGPATEWTDRNLFVDNVRVYNSDGELIAKDDFREGLHDGLFDIEEHNGNNVAVSLGLPTETGAMDGNYAASFVTNADEIALAITSDAYPAGSTVTFDAYVPNDATWWGVRMTEDSSSTSIYSSTHYVNYADLSYKGEWSTYTATLPESGGPYYFYFVTECKQWSSNLLIDNIVVRSASGAILTKEDFNIASFDDSIFTILNSSAISLVEEKEDTIDIHFTAYDSPTFDGQVDGVVKNQIDEAYKKMAEAGFTKALALREGYTTVQGAKDANPDATIYEWIKWRSDYLESKVGTALDLAQKYGMSYYVKDWSFYGLGRTNGDDATVGEELVNTEAQFSTIINDMFDSTNPYISHPAYAGNYAIDEPGNNDTGFNALKWQAKYYNQAMAAQGKEGEIVVNLNPAYDSQDNRDFWDKLFGQTMNKYESTYATEYLQRYLNIATATDTKINYISWDYYPFMLDTADATKKQLREENYLYNFNVMAKAAKTNNLALRLTLQSSKEEGHDLRDVNAADLRFQIYTGMAFGVNDFTYYKYSGTNGEGIFDYVTGETNEILYQYAKEVNNEVRAIEDFFADYKWDSIMAKQGTNTTTMSDRMIDGVQLSNSDSISHGKISSVTATQDTICGVFNAVESAETRPHGYMFVNLADPANNASDTVTINFADGVKGVCVCIDGKQEIVKVSGSYTFTLTAGAGAFIVPIY